MPDYSDSFDRANSTTLPGAPEVGGPYTVRTGTWGINSNALYTPVSNAEAQVTFPAYADLDFSLAIDVVGISGGLLFRWIDTNNTWLLAWGSTGIALWRRTAGAWQQITNNYTKTRSPGDTVRVVAVGRVIMAYHNTTMIFAIDDPFASQATATAGFRIASDTTSRIRSAAAVAGAFTTGSGQAFELDPAGADHDWSTHLYKGRDSKIADEGAVA